MGSWKKLYPFRDTDYGMEDEEVKDVWKKAYHEGMVDAFELLGADPSRISFRRSERHSDDDGMYYNERSSGRSGRYRY